MNGLVAVGGRRTGMDVNRYLVVARVGKDSLHQSWLEPSGARGFDLFLSSYDADLEAPAGKGIFLEHRPGSKVAGYGAFLRTHRKLLSSYDYVALFDDDLLIDSGSITRLFDIAQRHNLKIAQPALTPESHWTYAALLRHPGFLLRYVSYIEMMCPVFRTDILEAISPLYDMGYESGIDLIWSNLVHETARDFAVIDAVPIEHTRRVGKGKAANGFGTGKRYEDDIHAILDRFGCEWLPCLPYGAIRTDGTHTHRRSEIMRAALKLLPTLAAKAPLKRRARNMAVYWKHLLSAPARNVRLEWPPEL